MIKGLKCELFRSNHSFNASTLAAVFFCGLFLSLNIANARQQAGECFQPRKGSRAYRINMAAANAGKNIEGDLLYGKKWKYKSAKLSCAKTASIVLNKAGALSSPERYESVYKLFGLHSVGNGIKGWATKYTRDHREVRAGDIVVWYRIDQSTPDEEMSMSEMVRFCSNGGGVCHVGVATNFGKKGCNTLKVFNTSPFPLSRAPGYTTFPGFLGGRLAWRFFFAVHP